LLDSSLWSVILLVDACWSDSDFGSFLGASEVACFVDGF
jgi:hypothetical protein